MSAVPDTPHVSVVIPVYNEADSVPPLAREIATALDGASYDWECVWIDDGSTDDSAGVVRALHDADPRHRLLQLEANAGQSAALFAGFRAARGDILATLDADGQNDPADLPALVQRVEAGDADMVNGYRRQRRDNLVRKIASRIGNGFRNAVTGRTVRDVGCSSRAFRRECVDILPAFKGMHRFLPTLVARRGFTLAEIPVNHRPRVTGQSKYTSWNRMWVGLADLFGVLWLNKRSFSYRVRC